MAPPPPSTGSTWLSLLASSSLGIALVASTPAEVRADDDAKLGRGPMRLVVQTFDQGSRKPVRSVQRAVTADELRKGVRVDLVGLEAKADDRVVAWVERGHANLEYDGRVARPGRGSLVGTASTNGGPVRIVVGSKKRALVQAFSAETGPPLSAASRAHRAPTAAWDGLSRRKTSGRTTQSSRRRCPRTAVERSISFVRGPSRDASSGEWRGWSGESPLWVCLPCHRRGVPP